MRRTPVGHWLRVACAVACCVASASADVVFLRNGGTLEGEVTQLADGSWDVRTRHVHTVLRASDVVDVRSAPPVAEEFERRRRRLEVDDGPAEAWNELARWAREQSYSSGARAAAEQAIVRNPNHLGARALLGHHRVEDVWLPHDEAMEARGLVRWEGVWIPAAEAQAKEHERRERRRLRDLRREIDRWSVALAEPDAGVRNAARGALLEIALRERAPAMGARVHALHRHYRLWWAAQPPAVSVSVRASQSQLIGLDERSIGLGSGTPVRVQLPRIRTISIGTTVGIPFR